MSLSMKYYGRIAEEREHSPELRECVEETIQKLSAQRTSTGRPGVLLGKIQSGKTRAFLGVIGRAFDEGYEAAVILTKGTKSLARQTLQRVKEDFRTFVKDDDVLVFDIMALPDLTQ